MIEPSTPTHSNATDRTWTTSYSATGDPVKLTEPGGVIRTRTFDAAGRLTTETGTGAEAATVQRTLSYDLAGRPTSVGAPGGDDPFTYNDRGSVLTADGPSGQASFVYDADGQPTHRTDAASASTFGYVKGRLTTVTDGITGTGQSLATTPPDCRALSITVRAPCETVTNTPPILPVSGSASSYVPTTVTRPTSPSASPAPSHRT